MDHQRIAREPASIFVSNRHREVALPGPKTAGSIMLDDVKWLSVGRVSHNWPAARGSRDNERSEILFAQRRLNRRKPHVKLVILICA